MLKHCDCSDDEVTAVEVIEENETIVQNIEEDESIGVDTENNLLSSQHNTKQDQQSTQVNYSMRKSFTNVQQSPNPESRKSGKVHIKTYHCYVVPGPTSALPSPFHFIRSPKLHNFCVPKLFFD